MLALCTLLLATEQIHTHHLWETEIYLCLCPKMNKTWQGLNRATLPQSCAHKSSHNSHDFLLMLFYNKECEPVTSLIQEHFWVCRARFLYSEMNVKWQKGDEKDQVN